MDNDTYSVNVDSIETLSSTNTLDTIGKDDININNFIESSSETIDDYSFYENDNDPYSIENFAQYTLDKWYKLVKDHEIINLKGEKYNCYKKTWLFHFSKLEILYYKRSNILPKTITRRLHRILDQDKDYFFKLSNRSPKDILEYKGEYKINDDEHRTIKVEKKLKQLEILRVNKIDQINMLLRSSKRTREDMKLFFADKTNKNKLYLVFQEWAPNLGISTEYRCYIKNNKLIGISLYKPEYYSTRTIIPYEIIDFFVTQIIDLFKQIDLFTYVVDVYILNNDQYNVYLIEINPFDEHTDTFSFDFDTIYNSDTLLITL